MLQHEPTPEVLHPPFTSNYPASLTEQETEDMTPQELAQAIVAVEERQGTPLQEGADSPVIQQAIEKSGLAITPDSLLAEIHRQRAQSHQNSAMTPHLTQNLSVRLATNDDYAKVWKFYAQQSGFSNAMQQNSPAAKINSTHYLSPGGTIIQNGQSVQYEIQSTSGPAEQSAIFIQIGPFHTVTTTLFHHAGDPLTTVHIVVANPR